MQRRMLTLILAAAFCGTGGVVAAQGSSTAGSATSSDPTKRASGPVNYGEPMVRLQQAAQKLRESIQAMAQQPTGERRNQAIRKAHEALLESQTAMIELPPEIRMGATGEQPNYTQSMARLQEAAQRLRDAVQAMAQQPAGPRRNDAMKQANQALFDTQQAMIQLPRDLRVSAASPGSASTGRSQATDARITTKAEVQAKDARTTIPAEVFVGLDTNNDFYLGKDEAQGSRAVTEAWDTLDRDRDGRVSRVEFMHNFEMRKMLP